VALVATALVAASCSTDIRGQPGVEGAVISYRAPGVAFGTFATFAVASQVGLVTAAQGGKVFATAPALRAALVAHLEARGFVRVADLDPANPPALPPDADLVVNVTALELAAADPAYWLQYAGYSQPADLGLPGYAWSYPWPWVDVPEQPGTLLVEVADLRGRTAGSGGAPGQIAVVWAALAYGVAPGGDWDAAPVMAALDRALAQSPYLATP
jgi:hypothetical protein